jgi:tetratricopeptide (TPR) repeat protein
MGPTGNRLASWLVILVVPALALAPVVASGDAGKGPKKSHDDAAESSPKNAPSKEYTAACQQGNAKYASRDFAGAALQFQKAIELSPHQPLGHYLLGEAQVAAGNLTEAEAALNRASLEASERDPAMRSRILFVLADLKERQKKWDDAKAAWQVYIDWANRYPKAGGFPSSAQARQQTIDTMLKQDKAYEIVRQRIEATKDGGVFTDLSKSPPAK